MHFFVKKGIVFCCHLKLSIGSTFLDSHWHFICSIVQNKQSLSWLRYSISTNQFRRRIRLCFNSHIPLKIALKYLNLGTWKDHDMWFDENYCVMWVWWVNVIRWRDEYQVYIAVVLNLWHVSVRKLKTPLTSNVLELIWTIFTLGRFLNCADLCNLLL